MATTPDILVRAELEHGGKTYTLGMKVGGDERKKTQRFNALLFSMRRTWAALEDGSYAALDAAEQGHP